MTNDEPIVRTYFPPDATAQQMHEAADDMLFKWAKHVSTRRPNSQPIVTTYDVDGNRTAGPAPWSDPVFDPLRVPTKVSKG